MIIGIDGNEANINNRVGVGQFAFQVIQHLYQLDHHNQYIIYLKDQPLADMPVERPNWQYSVFGPKKLWTKFALPFHLFTDKIKPHVFFSPSHYSPLFCPCPTIPTIHDLGYLKYPQQFTSKDLYQLTNWTKRSIFQAKRIIAVSEFTKNEIHQTYRIPKNKIFVCYNGTDTPPHEDPNISTQVLKKFSLKSKNYFLYLGTLKPNKNIPLLINAFAKSISPRLVKEGEGGRFISKLVIAGKKGWLFDDIFTLIKKLHLQKNVIFTDYIDDATKWVLYQNAKALIIPSFYEGFGIPAIEAQKCHAPVISSNIPALKEILGPSAYYFNPYNQSELSQILLNIENLDTLPQNPHDFSWQKTAESVLKVLTQV